ncbi:hypothetical protein [Micrococcus lylae]|uniref:HK97 gp10 family phage protein n=1 Tax=Micrococcus lylae TaxID=1273 RepID=A0ABY2K2P2_9MICC|nr:hypothetical protein [Micrococcus lylae]TFI01634.1 hypothetical protein E4A49_01045 [Micrococcus lylae]
MAEVRIGPELMAKAWAHPGILPALQAKANGIAARAQALAAAEDVDMQVTTVAGTRPGGRQYVNVVGDNVEQEWGSSRTGRRRILGRAAKGG